MKKQIVRVFEKWNYLLGIDSDGKKNFLQVASWNCGWYWGFGYVETYTNNTAPERSRDIATHSHFDSLFFKGNKNGYDAFKEYFKETPLTDKEIWTLCELMKTFYIMREYSDTLNRGGAHYTTNPCKELIQNENEYNRINNVVLPELFKQIYELLGGIQND